MDELPELPFEKVLSYLNLEDRLKARAVSRAWRNKFDRYPVKTLFYAERPLGFISKNGRLVSGAFTCSFIFSTKFNWFFDTFGLSVLSNLKRLSLCDVNLQKVGGNVFASTLNSFTQLEELSLFRFYRGDQVTKLELNLPMLTSFQLERVYSIQELILDAPRLRKVRIMGCDRLNLAICHVESVEWLLVDRWGYTEVKKLKHLQNIYLGIYSRILSTIGSTFLSGLDQLKEFHTVNSVDISNLFEQKLRYGRTDLKIYLRGRLLKGPRDPAIRSLSLDLNEDTFVQLAKSPSRLADEIPFKDHLNYSPIERVHPELVINILSRCTDLSSIIIDREVQDIERFLNILKKFPNIVKLEFKCDQPQELFDRLPEHCAVQTLTMDSAPLGLEFLCNLKHLNDLHVRCLLDTELIRKIFNELPLLSFFKLEYEKNKLQLKATIEAIRKSGWIQPEGYRVGGLEKAMDVDDLEAATQLIFEIPPQKRRKRRRR